MDTSFDKYHRLRNLGSFLCEIKRKQDNQTKKIEQRAEQEGIELM